MTTLRAGDLVRFKNPDQGQQEMTVTQVSGNFASCAWFDADGNHTFRTIHAEDLHTSVEAHRVAKVRQQRIDDEFAAQQAAIQAAEAAKPEAE